MKRIWFLSFVIFIACQKEEDRCGTLIQKVNEGTIYTDQTGAFPVSSYKGNRVMFVAYDYRSNGIFIRPMKSNSNESMIAAFTDVYESLTSKGLKPKLNVMDNACSKAVEAYIRSTGADIQLVNADDHRVNASERAIQTWKNH